MTTATHQRVYGWPQDHVAMDRMQKRIAELIALEWDVPSIGRWVGLSDDQVRQIIRRINNKSSHNTN